MTTRSGGLNDIPIRPRETWATDRPARGALSKEDVRFLLVHHSASPNDYSDEDVPGILRGFFDYHTSPDKRWNDIAYNFLIDRFGGVWEGRTGSIAGPVAGDATGGNQGFSQLVCLIGDFSTESPTPEAVESLVVTLSWLADRYEVSTQTDVQVTFVSRGSNRWPVGELVTTASIAGHRDMSITACPGDQLYSIVVSSLAADVESRRSSGTSATTSQPPPAIPPTTFPNVAPTIPISESSDASVSTISVQPVSAQEEPGSDDSEAWIRGLSGSVIAGIIAFVIRRRISNARAASSRQDASQ